MFYHNLKVYKKLKILVKRFPFIWDLLVWLKKCLIKLSRLKDVLMMMILLFIWPKQTFRFSTRKVLPVEKNKFSKYSRLTIPYELLKSKSSKIPKMKEITVIGTGPSFDVNILNEINGPIFLSSLWHPLRIDKDGKIFKYKDIEHFTDGSYTISMLENFKDLRELKKENITYLASRPKLVELFKKKGHNVISVDIYGINEDGNHFPEGPSLSNQLDDNQCRRISIVQKIFKKPLPPFNLFPQTGSFIPFLCAISFFAEKINVYGWDFFLESSPEKMGYWQLFFNMYKYKADKARQRTHFEEALLNFYYGYQLSKDPKFKIHGFMGKLSKHKKLIDRIERVLFKST